MTEERDNVVAENEELQDQLVQANAAATNGNVKLMELRWDLNWIKPLIYLIIRFSRTSEDALCIDIHINKK